MPRIIIRHGAAPLRESMRWFVSISLALFTGLMATGSAQDLDGEINAFDRQITGRQLDLGALDLKAIVGKNGTSGAPAQNAEASPKAPDASRYRWTQSAMDAGREELIKSAGSPAMAQYIRSAYTRPEFDRIDRFFAQYGCANNDIADALMELVIISWEFVNQRQPGTPDYDPAGIRKVREQIAARFATSNVLSALSDADKQRFAENFKYEAQLMSNLHRGFKTNPNPKLQQRLESLHQKLGQSLGLDLVHLKLTANGFESR
jgi:hypothetical protein